jgi:CARDB
MKKTNKLHCLLIMGVIIFGCLTVTPKATNADTLSILGQILDLIHPFDPQQIPSGSDLTNLMGLLQCVVDDPSKAPDCIVKYSSLLQDNNYGDTIVMVAQLYVDVENKDVWGIVGVVTKWLGDDAPCIIADIVLPGVGGSLCALIEDIIKGVAEALEAIGQFFADLGEAVWEGLKAAYCFLFGCPEGGPPPKPLEQEIYEVYFVPRVSDGLNAIEAVDLNAFNKLREDIKKSVIDKFKADNKFYYTPEYWPTAVQQYTDATNTAAKKFTELVEANWSADIVQRVLSDLGQQRSQFNGPSEIGLHVLGAAQGYEASPQTWDESETGSFIRGNCTSTFTNSFKFAHVDRWISKNHDKASTLKAITNNNWCSEIFWKSNQLQFADRFRYYMTKGTGWCQDAGQTLTCDTAAHYQECRVLLGSVGQKDQCSVNIATAGKQVAQEIDAYFKSHGSTIPCEIKTYGQNTPVDFVCTRPTQGHACNEYYQDHFGTLPVKVLNCKVKETAEFANLKNRVKYVVEMLKKGGDIHPHGPLKVEEKAKMIDSKGKMVGLQASLLCNKIDIADQDPLIAYGESCVVEKVKSDPDQNFGFGPPSSKTGFDYSLKNYNFIDGVSTPVLNESIDKGVLGKIIKDKSMTTVTPESKLEKILESGGKPPKPEPGDKLPTDKMEIVTSQTAAQAKITGAGIAGVQTETTPMSGKLPAGSGLGSGISGAPTSTPFSLTLLPDITSTDQVKVAGIPVAWGGTLTVDASQAISKNKNNSGLCEFQIEYSVHNIGKATAGSFRSLWTNSVVKGSWHHDWSPITPESVKSEKDLVPLKPGRNVLQLVLDDLQQVQESNETNNTFHVNVNVTGSCGAAPGITPPAGTPRRR